MENRLQYQIIYKMMAFGSGVDFVCKGATSIDRSITGAMIRLAHFRYHSAMNSLLLTVDSGGVHTLILAPHEANRHYGWLRQPVVGLGGVEWFDY